MRGLDLDPLALYMNAAVVMTYYFGASSTPRSSRRRRLELDPTSTRALLSRIGLSASRSPSEAIAALEREHALSTEHHDAGCPRRRTRNRGQPRRPTASCENWTRRRRRADTCRAYGRPQSTPRSATATARSRVSNGAGRTVVAGYSDPCVSTPDSTRFVTFHGLLRCYRCRPAFAVQPLGGSARLMAVGRARSLGRAAFAVNFP